MDSTQNSSEKLDVYQMVTDRIIELLKKGVAPWRLPWTETGIPMNLISKRPYRGINIWLLLSLSYERNLFLTWDQLKAIGGSVFKGEKGHIIVFWKTRDKKPVEMDANNQPKKVPMLRYYKVFNIAQCKDIPEHLLPEKHVPMEQASAVTVCDSFISGMPGCPPIKFKMQQAFYDLENDFVNMPKRKTFTTEEAYYNTLFHELTHSTGHPKRLNRPTITEMAEFGSPIYGMEELIAELGAAYLCNYGGIMNKQIDSSAAYIKGWLEKIKGDKKFVITASGKAQAAVDYILNLKPEEPSKEDPEPSEMLTES